MRRHSTKRPKPISAKAPENHAAAHGPSASVTGSNRRVARNSTPNVQSQPSSTRPTPLSMREKALKR